MSSHSSFCCRFVASSCRRASSSPGFISDVGSRVLELGPGPGFFSVRVARSIPRGHLFLVDLQREMLEKARQRIRRAGVANVSFTQAGADMLPFAADSFDVAFVVTVLGEVPSAGACLEAIRHSLVPGGILSISELPGDPDAMSEAEVAALAHSAVFEFAESFRMRGGFTANFRKPAIAERRSNSGTTKPPLPLFGA